MWFCTPRFRIVIPGWLKVFCVVERVVKVMLCKGACVGLLRRRSMGPHVSSIGRVVYVDLATSSMCTWNGCTVTVYWAASFPGSHMWPGNEANTHLAKDMWHISDQGKVLVAYSKWTWYRTLALAKINVKLSVTNTLLSVFRQFYRPQPYCDQLWGKIIPTFYC